MNDDPIKENNPFRIGLDNLTGDDDINSGIEYSDLHDCSNDLSDRGSRREEIAHARFAEQQRRNQYRNTYYASSNKKVVIAKDRKAVAVYLIVFLFVILPVIEIIGATIFEVMDTVKTSTKESNYTPIYNYNYDYETVAPEFEVETDTIKENVHIEAGKADNGNLMVRLENQSLENMYSVQVQMVFFDAENKPIAVTDLEVYSLYANDIKTIEVYNVPEYTRYDFLITERYADDAPYVSEY